MTMEAKLNIAYLNGASGLSRKRGNSSVAVINQDKQIGITENGTIEVVADSGYTGLGKVSVNVNVEGSGGSTSLWTGHADVEGLRAIGWTEEDIAYYQENGVNWNEEDDQYHKVPEDNIALYGVLTADNIYDYADRLVYLPKIDTANVKDMSSMFYDCPSLVSVPQFDTANVKDMSYMFGECYSTRTANLKGLKLPLQINDTSLLEKDSLLYIINNEAATSAITITLSSYCYNKYANDPDVVSELANHPNISLAS